MVGLLGFEELWCGVVTHCFVALINYFIKPLLNKHRNTYKL